MIKNPRKILTLLSLAFSIPASGVAAATPPPHTKWNPVNWTCTSLNHPDENVSRILKAHPDYNGESVALLSHESTEICLSQALIDTPAVRIGYLTSPVTCNAKGECYLFVLVPRKDTEYVVVPSNRAAPLGHTTTIATFAKTQGKFKLTAKTGAVLSRFSVPVYEIHNK